MEEGSLLKEVLQQTDHSVLENCLIVDLFLLLLLDDDTSSSSCVYSPAYFQDLAELAVSINAFVQAQDYPWMMGGDGPVFGVHLSSCSSAVVDDEPEATPASSTSIRRPSHRHHIPSRVIPHLRAQCRYGVSVADEWFLIGCLLRYTAAAAAAAVHETSPTIVAECWDVDDGQVLLIESSNELPDWVDVLGPDACRHRCWIQAGRVCLVEPLATDLSNHHLAPSQLSLAQALDVWQQHKQQQADGTSRTSFSRISSPDPVQAAIEKRIGYHRIAGGDSSSASTPPRYHRGAVVLPRGVARLFQKRPDLVTVACQAFAEWVTSSQRMGGRNQTTPTSTPPSNQRTKDPVSSFTPATEIWCDDDWVWTTHAFGRTQYAMLRNLESNEASEQAIIGSLLHPNHRLVWKRLERQASRQGMPHLQYGVPVGRRLVIGLYHILSHQPPQPPPPSSLSLAERRIQYWAALVARVSAGIDDSSRSSSKSASWILDAWQAGPNHAAHSLDDMLQCPVLEPEGLLDVRELAEQLLTPLSHPEETVAVQIKRELVSAKRVKKNGDDAQEEEFPPSLPGPDDVESEDWMYLSDDDERFRQFTNNNAVPMAEKTANGANSTQKAQCGGYNNRSDESNTTEGVHRNGFSFADEMLGGIHSFVKGKSSIEGVDHSQTSRDNTHTNIEVELNPTVFLNLLQMTLRAKSANELTFPTMSLSIENDSFFSNEDYEMAELSEDDYNDDEGDANDAEQDHEMTELMHAMDQELQTSESVSRQMDHQGFEGDGSNNDDIAQQAHVLSNLLRSLEEGAANSGPVQNILREMGIHPS